MNKKALFTCVNLLGDTVSITPALDIWHKKNPDFDIEVRLQDQEVCRFMAGEYYFGKVCTVAGDFEAVRCPPDRHEYTFFHNFNILNAHRTALKHNIHITEAYARLLGLFPVISWPILPTLDPTDYLDNPYVCVAPFAGNSERPELGNERALTYAVWSEIITYLSNTVEVLVLGYSGSPWPVFKQYVPETDNVQYLSEDSLLTTLNYIFGKNCVGFIGQNSGLMHCVSGACKQLNLEHFPVLAFMTSVISPVIHFPTGVPRSSLVIRGDYCNKVGFQDIEHDLKKYKDILK